MRQRVKAGLTLAALALTFALAPVRAEDAPAPDLPPLKTDWDRTANIKDSAVRLGALHRREGSQGVLKFLANCYKTHTLASAFTSGLEACMAQDYMHSQVLANIYARLPKDKLAKLNAPSPEMIAKGMGERFVAAFTQYKVAVVDANAFKQLVDQNGLPIFLKAVFPNIDPPANVGASSKPETKDKN